MRGRLGMSHHRFVTYARVSTRQQGESGLGLEAQRHAVAQYLGVHQAAVIAEFVEVESGRKTNRPELAKALALCSGHQATLVVAKLDRLARNAAFLLTLQDSGVDFVCADMPQANRFTIGIMAVVAEAESEANSARVKAALAARERRGLKRPPTRFTKEATLKGQRAQIAIRRAQARQRAVALMPIVMELRAAGAQSGHHIAAGLNARGIPTARGGLWRGTEVNRILRYMERKPTLAEALALIRDELRHRGGNRERNARIYDGHRRGRTLQSLGIEHGLTPERIRQLCDLERRRRKAPRSWYRRRRNAKGGVALRLTLETLLMEY